MPPRKQQDDDSEDFELANQAYEEEEDNEQDADAAIDEPSLDEEEDDPEARAQRAEIARKEKERLKQQQQQKNELLAKMKQEEDAAGGAAADKARGEHRLKFLLRQAEIFQHFVPANAKAEPKKNQRGRHAGARNENDEDAELLKDEEDLSGGGHRLTVQPSILSGCNLRDYQMQGLNWLIHLYDNGINGILADEMGLGKTLQTISLLAYLREYRGIKGYHMVVVPKSTMHNWINEFRRFCPSIRVCKFHGNQEEREQQKREYIQPGKFDVMVTSYEMVIKEKGHFRKFIWRYIIIDEAHRIKNENSTLSKTVRMFRTNYRLLITGTPLQNNLHELWALLNFLLPEVFASAEKFEEWFSLGDGGKEKEAEVVQQLHKVLRPFLLRRVKSDVERGLPPKKETILKIGMSEMQRKWYAALLQKDLETLSGGGDRSKLLNVVMQLRKCCNHPYLFQGAEPGPPFFTGEHLVENSGKLVLLDKLLPKLQARGSRVLIFSQMTRALDILEDYAMYRGYKYSRIDGNTSGDDRENAIDSFNCENSEKFMFLLSTRAGGLGINLATADIVVLYDSDWNPQMDLQAMDRAHRIGQKKEVQVFRLCIENSIEEKVIEKAYKKLRLDALVIQQGRLTDNSQNKVDKEDLMNMVRYGAEMVFSSEPTNLTDADVDAILARGEEETRQLNEKMKQFTENAKSFALDGGIGNIYDYKDEEEQKALDLKHLAGQHWIDPPKRERKGRLNYNENAYFNANLKNKAGPKLPKMPQLQDFQFYDTQRLTQLFEKDHTYELFKIQQSERERALKSQGASEEAVAQALAPSPEDPQPMTEEEQQEKERLLSQGFHNWTRKDFNSFVRVCEKYGRENIPQIAAEIEGKTEDEVREYSKVFWSRYKELSDWEKVIKNIERGEQKIQRQADIQNAIANKLDKYKNPWQELKLVYGANKGKAYTEDEDRFILCMVHKLGYGNWDDLKAEVRKSWRFRFDWFFKSRTPQELSRRCETLIRLIEKENEDAEGGAKKGGRKTKDSGAGAGGEDGAHEMPAGKTSGRKKRPTQAAQQGQQQGSDGEGGSPAPAAKKARA